MAQRLNNFGRFSMDLLRQKAFYLGTPTHATFELTPRCGFNCRMCYVHLPQERISQVGKGRELTADEWLALGKQATEAFDGGGIISLCLTGGDPLCHPEFEKIWMGLSQMGIHIVLQTNGASFTEDILNLLEEYPPDTVKITLYGSNDDVYREVCRVEQGFTRTAKGIFELKKRDIPVQLVTTFVKQNQTDFENIADFAREHQLPWYYSMACYPSLRGAVSEAEACRLSIQDVGCTDEVFIQREKQAAAMQEKIPGMMCASYRTGFSISWDGNMRFCLFLNEPNISVLEKPLTQCWQELLQYWKNLKWPEPCYTCADRMNCVRCLASLACSSGGLGKVNPAFCEKIRAMIHRK